jgi:hypothetical protein
LAAQSTSDASIGPAGIGGFEEGEFEGDSPTEESRHRSACAGPTRSNSARRKSNFGNFYGDVGWRGECGRGIVASRRQMHRSKEGRLRVTGGKTPTEYIFSELPHIADIGSTGSPRTA